MTARFRAFRIGQRFSNAELLQLRAWPFPHAVIQDIPVIEIQGKDPEPADWVDDFGDVRSYQRGQPISKPISVEKVDDGYLLWDGNHRLKQAYVNRDPIIRAFVYDPGEKP